METKFCVRCETDQPINEFYLNRYRKRITVKCQTCRYAETEKRRIRRILPDHLDDSYTYCVKGDHWVLKDVEIYKKSMGRKGYGHACRACDAERMRVSARRYKLKLRAWLNSLKERPCDRCGLNWPPFVLDWHHRDPATKKFNMGSAHRIKDRTKILAEVAKCDLYCSNCHRILTHTED